MRPSLRSYLPLALLLCSLATACADSDADPVDPEPASALQISQFGITWSFAASHEHGQYANGDHWVLGPVDIIGIDPPSGEVDGRVVNGTMLNPSPTAGSTQGYDSLMYGQYGPDYDPGLNVAEGVSAARPLGIEVGSLVSSVSLATEDTEDGRVVLEKVAILTVVSTVPAADAFRPPYCGADKTSYFAAADLDRSLLQALAPVDSTPELAEVEGWFEHVWLDHVPNWLTDRACHTLMPCYGRERGGYVGTASLLLQLDLAAAAKETLLVRLIQHGIDTYGVAQDGGEDNWVPNGGHESGRLWPILFAGLMLHDEDMMAIRERPEIDFGEIGQSFYVAQQDVDTTHAADWDPDTRSGPAIPYESADIGTPEWGIRHSTGPQGDNKAWSAIYRRCCTGFSWYGQLLAAHIMDAKELWRSDALFDYVDRYWAIETDTSWRCWGGAGGFFEQMWEGYRASYGAVYVPADSTAPSPPADVVATAQSGSACELSWSAATDDVAVAGYAVMRDDEYIATSAGTTYSDSGLTSGTSYDYTLRAFDTSGIESATTDPAVCTTP